MIFESLYFYNSNKKTVAENIPQVTYEWLKIKSFGNKSYHDFFIYKKYILECTEEYVSSALQVPYMRVIFEGH